MCKKFFEGQISLTAGNSLSQVNPFELFYYLVESNDEDTFIQDTFYGIEVVKKCLGKDVETQTVRNFSNCRKTTEQVIKTLLRNSVTPVTLYCVLDDLLAV